MWKEIRKNVYRNLITFSIGGWEGIVGRFCDGFTLLPRFGHVFDGTNVQFLFGFERRSETYIQRILFWLLVPNCRENVVLFRLT